jgi:putative transposase
VNQQGEKELLGLWIAHTERAKFWLHVVTELKIRKVICTTNAIESVNMSLRKVTKSRGSFPNDEALIKLYYLALRNISKKWTMPVHHWKAALNRFTIMFDERMPKR